MSIQTYFCPFHDQMFDIQVPFSRKHPPETVICPISLVEPIPDVKALMNPRTMPHTGSWRPSAAYFIVKDGTGAAKRSRINA